MALFYYKLKSIIIISFCCIIFYQCSQNNLESEGAQDNILNKELFSKVLVEFALAESAANLNIKGVSVQKIDSVYAFDPLYENKVRKSQYDSTLIYYAHHPKEYKLIYENVLVVLSKLEAKHSLVKTNTIKK
jgi:hypothetical protein